MILTDYNTNRHLARKKRRKLNMSANTLTAPAIKLTDMAMNQGKTERKEQIEAAVYKDITRDPEFWRRAILS